MGNSIFSRLGLGGKAQAAAPVPAPPPVSAPRAKLRTAPGAVPGDAPAAIAESKPIDNYGEIGTVVRILTAGSSPLYAVPVDMQEDLLGIERQTATSKDIWILVPSEPLSKERVHALSQELRQLRGKLAADGYAAAVVRKADSSVRGEVLKAIAFEDAGSATSGRNSALEQFDAWIEAAVRQRASDIHILVFGSQAAVKLRIDGELEPLALPGFRTGLYSRATAVKAVAAGYNYARNAGSGGSQYTESAYSDVMIEREVMTERVLLRYQNKAAAPGSGQFGAKTVIRVLYLGGNTVGSLEDAGYAASHLAMLRDASRTGSGMIIFAGVTGSGKSTSLKLFIERMPGLERMAVHTIEDPIEYIIGHGMVHQSQVTRDLSDPEETRQRYGMAVKAELRSDPDAVLVGEVRDEITARTALVLAETGHLSMFSLHAHLITNIVGRLTNKEVGLSRDELTAPQIINLLVYQSLVPLLCQHCCLETGAALEQVQQLYEQAAPSAQGALRDDLIYMKDTVAVLSSKFGFDMSKFRWKNEIGCSHCNHRGTKGRTIVAEMWMPDRRWLELTRAHDDYGALTHYRSFSDGDLSSAKMTGKTVFEHSLHKALHGQIDVRRCGSFESFHRYEPHAAQSVHAHDVPRLVPVAAGEAVASARPQSRPQPVRAAQATADIGPIHLPGRGHVATDFDSTHSEAAA